MSVNLGSPWQPFELKLAECKKEQSLQEKGDESGCELALCSTQGCSKKEG